MNLTYKDVFTFTDKTSNAIEDESYDYIVGIARGGLIPATLISYKSGIPLLILSATTRNSHRGFKKPSDHQVDGSAKTIAILADRSKKVLIVEDIIDSGLTIDIISSILKCDYDVAALVYNRSLEEKYQPKYAFKEIYRAINNDWVIFPWDVE